MIDFHADSSGWSGFTSQRFTELSDTFVRIGVDFYRVNVDELEEVVLEADVRVVCICISGFLFTRPNEINIAGAYIHGVQGRQEGRTCHGRGRVEFEREHLVFIDNTSPHCCFCSRG